MTYILYLVLIFLLSKKYIILEFGQVKRRDERMHTRNLHFLRLSMYHNAWRSIVVSRACKFRARRIRTEVKWWCFEEESFALSSPAAVYRLADRSSSTSLAGNTNRDAKITFMSRIYRREGKRERERAGGERVAGCGIEFDKWRADSTSAGGGVSDYARCNQPLYYITGWLPRLGGSSGDRFLSWKERITNFEAVIKFDRAKIHVRC